MMTQIKLHLLQGDPLLAARRNNQRTSSNSTQEDSEYENMKAYNSFITPAELEVFEDGIFTESQLTTLTSREDVFMDTIFHFDLIKTTLDQPDNHIINIDAIKDNKSDTSDWDPEDLWVS
jgi:hypothetical protein